MKPKLDVLCPRLYSERSMRWYSEKKHTEVEVRGVRGSDILGKC